MRNWEIKCRCGDLDAVRQRAWGMGARDEGIIEQEDTFFPAPGGRLKLRDFRDGRGELIHYSRPDRAGPKLSEFLLSPVAAPGTLREALARAYGILGRVVKRRRLYLADRTRIHLDSVEGLGAFVELEVVLGDSESAEDGDGVARALMGRLGIGDGQLVSGAYIDLLQSRTE